MKRWSICMVLVFLLAGCGYFSSDQNLNTQNEETTDIVSPFQHVNEDGEIKETPRNKPFSTYQKTTNFLLIGVDSRGEKNSRSDVIMVARYEPTDKTVKLVSLMRDSYVKIPEHPLNYGKLNHAYYYGGKTLLKETVEDNFGIPIDHVAIIDFEGFVSVINTLAPNGLEVEVSEEMIRDLKLAGEPGKRVLKGEELLGYVRFRHDAESDFGRVNRQQQVLISLKDEAVKQLGSLEGITQLPDLLSEMFKHVETDIKLQDYFSLGATFVLNPVTNVETLRVPVSNSFENKSYDHVGAVLQLDLEENIEAIHQFFSDEGEGG
ncbi:LCP family protein [Cytobacillus sp. FJAT-54145]|uniref:Regulatory protein MsrR n=1 Tax=Cytobacillus spartinae TaxID=3299023 RepID=A0ABW6KCU7_9BACI